MCFSSLISSIASLCLFQTSVHLFFSSSFRSLLVLFRSFCAPFPPVSLLIVSASFLILSADILIVLADAIRKSTCRKGMLIAPALSCASLWYSWEGKVRILLTCFSPRMSTNQDGLSDESDRSDWSDKSDESENQSRALPLMGEMEGALPSPPPANFKTSSAFIVNRAL